MASSSEEDDKENSYYEQFETTDKTLSHSLHSQEYLQQWICHQDRLDR